MSTNREIKFRVWDNVDYMSKPFTLHSLMSAQRTEFTSECIVMQYTGLKDKNGREIYEGDILRHEVAVLIPKDDDTKGMELSEDTMIGQVVFEDGCLTFKAPRYTMSGCWNEELHGEEERYTFEIIGNIHENQELIKP